MYDLRSNQPLLVKDHFYNLPIKSLAFHDQTDLVVSADSKIIKMWNKDNVRITVLTGIYMDAQLNVCKMSAGADITQRQTGLIRQLSVISCSFPHREKCSPPYSLRPTSMMFASILIQVRITSTRSQNVKQENATSRSRSTIK